ncbi:DUF1624 domain-containing protein [Microbulbifer sp. YPW16]|uniref:DUF1624 domain-containing protein n=1 Tax=Microbulbifer sp. YPW16 TaxID=2904242 RepID=UPI001E549E1D|nr:heparan-alpha-glucosaminide N-acetyltransferase domain-containing protein [Microbulbifer sp. YPW16]UHQ56378.1 heparan-alpha-glucosaminide N-acetyltransferase domain-containing protein [Microbulbifer sp. YPW16]
MQNPATPAAAVGPLTPGPAAEASDTRAGRLVSVDFARGLVMVIMALDHVRDFTTAARFAPEELGETSPAYFFTRWITHFCAPLFVLLAGMGAGFMRASRSPRELSLFLLSRGFWLILIEQTVMSFGWSFVQPQGYALVLTTLSMIGFCMIFMALFIHLPRYPLLVLSVVIIAGHNLLDGRLVMPEEGPPPVWYALHEDIFTRIAGLPLVVVYPLLPWLAVMPLGYLLAGLYREPAVRRRRVLLALGFGAVVLFLVLRVGNFYGDPVPWMSQASYGMTLVSFFNVDKYPPSLLYLLMTLGPGLLLLAWSERLRGPLVDIINTFGRVPFAYYILHIYLAHLLALAIAQWQGFGWRAAAGGWWGLPDGYGVSLPAVYVTWLAVVALLYPFCRWLAGVKARRRDWWLSYL